MPSGIVTRHQRFAYLAIWGTPFALLLALSTSHAWQPPEPRTTTALAGWGADHVGKSHPEYITGDECLFCHRKIGAQWSENPHHRTLLPIDRKSKAYARLQKSNPDVAKQVEFQLGESSHVRFLRRSKGYGRMDMLTSKFARDHEGLVQQGVAKWDGETFAKACAGCHTTAVDHQSAAFSAVSLDCYTCHGNVSLDHTKAPKQVHFSKSPTADRVVVSICGQCHLRGGRSRTSKRPYPNTYVAGDNLFRDFRVDFSARYMDSLPHIERHIYLNAKSAGATAKSKLSCISCHNVHSNSTKRHTKLPRSKLCASCHKPEDNSLLRGIKLEKKQTIHNRTCRY